jgi:2-polyprenyl-6-methoxyphenol hydroxylase-like FAD-dependent oxidoreductase
MKQFPNPFVEALIPFAKEKKANIDHRPLGNLLVPLPWNRGRVVLIGDAVAATTPHLASGAGIGIESGIVLAEELGRRATLQDALDHFHRSPLGSLPSRGRELRKALHDRSPRRRQAGARHDHA